MIDARTWDRIGEIAYALLVIDIPFTIAGWWSSSHPLWVLAVILFSPAALWTVVNILLSACTLFAAIKRGRF